MPVDIHGKKYVTVAERVQEAHAADLISIQTELVSNDDKKIIFKAFVTTKKGQFTGWAEETRGSQGIAGQSPVEVAETSAVGRALGFAGFGLVDSIASADEVINKTIEPLKPPKNTAVVENLVERAEKIAERAKVAKPVADKIVGVYLDATVKTGTSAKGPWTKTTYIVEVDGQKQFIAVFGPKKDCKAGDVLIFTDVENGTYGRTAKKVEKEQPPASNEPVEAEDFPF